MHESATVMLEGRSVAYKIRASQRARYLSLRINLGTGLVVVMPPGFRRSELPRVFEKKAKWIVKTLDHYETILRQAGLEVPAGQLLFMGRPYTAQILHGEVTSVDVKSGQIVLTLAPRDRRRARRVLESWFRRQAMELVNGFVTKVNERYRFKVGRVFIRDQRSKWGACSSQGNLSFNWRLVMAPLDVLRYVVVHELCHLAEFNHTKNFWELVAREAPDYARHREWLKTRGPLLGMLPESVSELTSRP